MKLNIICYRDVNLDCYLIPQFINTPIDSQYEGICRSLARADDNTLSQYKDLELYNLGTYDDSNCQFYLIKPVLLGRFDGVVDAIVKKRGVSVDA